MKKWKTVSITQGGKTITTQVEVIPDTYQNDFYNPNKQEPLYPTTILQRDFADDDSVLLPTTVEFEKQNLFESKDNENLLLPNIE